MEYSMASVKRFATAAALLLGLASVAPAARQQPPAAPKRIVSLVPAVTEMLFALGAGPRVVAVSSFDHFPAEVETLPRVGALLDPDTERILSLQPDLVVTYGSQTELDVALHRAGIRTYSYRHGGVDGPRTLLVFGREPGTLRSVYVAGGMGFMHDLLTIAGATNVFADMKRES